MKRIKITTLTKPIIFLITVLFSDIAVSESKPETWTPDPKFRIEKRSYTETLIFVSGVSYALTSSNLELKQLGKENFFCLKDTKIVGSELLIDILNKQYSANITSEQAIQTIVQGLKIRFPCRP